MGKNQDADGLLLYFGLSQFCHFPIYFDRQVEKLYFEIYDIAERSVPNGEKF